MNNFKRGCVASMAVAALATSAPARSVPVTAGSPVIFDFTSPTAGPFTRADVQYGIDYCTLFETNESHHCHGTDTPDNGTIRFFDGPDGSGSMIDFIPTWSDYSAAGDNIVQTTGRFAGLADGVFSLVYTSAVGDIDAAPFVLLTDARGVTTRVDGVAAVPEPGSIALLGIGALAVSTAARRRRSLGPSKQV